jgi:hypothetical protein
MLAAGDQTTSLDIATAIVAGYAAIVATGAVFVQGFTWWQSWATRVEVDIGHMHLLGPNRAPEPAIVFKITNHSSHPVKITHLSLAPVKNDGQHLLFPQPLPLGLPAPWEIAARDAITMHQPLLKSADVDPRRKTRAQVVTSDGKTFRSKKIRAQELTPDATNARSKSS